LHIPESIDPADIILRLRPKRWEQAIHYGRPSTPAPAEVSGAQFVPDVLDRRTLHWFAGDAKVGTWVAAIDSMEWSQEFEHDSAAPIALTLDLRDALARPEAGLRALRLRINDGVSHQPLGPQDLDLRPLDGVGSAPWDSAGSSWTLRTRTDAAHVELAERGREAMQFEFAVPDRNEAVTLTFWRGLHVEVRAFDGDARIGAPEVLDSLSPVVVAIDHDGRVSVASAKPFRSNACKASVSQPGRYRVSLPPNARYVPHPAIEVEVKAGESTPIAVFHQQRAAK
jgi:hypothetical protein